MEANEIRVGNWLNDPRPLTEFNKKYVNNPDNGYFKATARDIQFAEEFEPIPLTEEILLKCGFKYVEEVFSYCCKFHNIYISTIGEFIFAPFCTNDSDCLVKIKYLHQLQNIYWCLVGEELEINL